MTPTIPPDRMRAIANSVPRPSVVHDERIPEPYPDWAPGDVVYCDACAGSGEGMTEGSACRVCRGRGEL